MRMILILLVGLLAGALATRSADVMVNPIFQASEQGDLKLVKMLL